MSESPTTPSPAVETRGSTLIVQPHAKMLDDQALKALTQAVDKNAGDASGVTLVVLDLSHVQLLPSLALGLLVQMSAACKSRKQGLKLAAVRPQLRQVFTVTRLDRVFDFSPSVDAALDKVAGT